VNLPNPFRTLARLIHRGPVRRTIRKPVSPRLGVLLLEDRVTPSTLPFELPRPMAPMILNSTAVDAQGNGAILYNAGSNVFVQLTDPQGNLVGGPIQVNTPVGGDAIAAGLAMAPDGNFVAVYYGAGPAYVTEGVSDGLYARRFSPGGSSPDASEFLVGSGYGGNGFFNGLSILPPTVAIDPDDNFVIDSGGFGEPFAQLYSWDLSSVSQPFPLDPNTQNSLQAYGGQVSVATDGTLVATYGGGDPWGATSSQFAQQFNYAADGAGGFQVAPLGDAVQLHNA
jgi:hypothetical protein